MFEFLDSIQASVSSVAHSAVDKVSHVASSAAHTVSDVAHSAVSSVSSALHGPEQHVEPAHRTEPAHHTELAHHTAPAHPASEQHTPAAPVTGHPVDRHAAEQSATALFRAMDGLGTDEDSIHNALRGKSPAEIAEIRRIYSDHFGGRNLDKDLESELSGGDLKAARAEMSGDQVVVAAVTLQNASTGLFTDEKAIHSTLEGISDPRQRAAVAAEFQKRTGRSLTSMLEREMSGSDLTISRALAQGDVAAARAARLDEAMHGGFLGLGIGTDEEAIYSTIEAARTPAEREALTDAYRKQTGHDLSHDMRREMSGGDLDVSTSLLKGDRAGAAAARIAVAADGLGTDEGAIFRQLEGKPPQERQAIINTYNQRYGRAAGGHDFDDMLKEELGTMDHERAHQLAQNGRLDPAFALRYSMDGFGTDEQMIRETLQGRSREQIAQIREQYRLRYGRDLDKELTDENSGRDGFEIQQLMLGDPKTPEETLARMNAAYDFERGSGAGLFGRAVTDLFSDSGEVLDLQHRRLEEVGNRIQRGAPTQEDLARLETIAGYQRDDVQNYQAARDTVTNTAAIGATAVVGTAATILTGGAAAPATAAAIGALAGGGAGMLVKAGMQGDSYSNEDMATDAAMAVVSAGSAGLSQAGVMTAGLRSMVGVSGNEMASLGQTITMETLRGGAQGLVQGVGTGALDERTWRGDGDGFSNFLHTVAVSTVTNAASGTGSAYAGGVMGGPRAGMDLREWGAVTGALGGVGGGLGQSALDPATWDGRWEDIAGRFGQSAFIGGMQGAAMGAAQGQRMMRMQADMEAARVAAEAQAAEPKPQQMTAEDIERLLKRPSGDELKAKALQPDIDGPLATPEGKKLGAELGPPREGYFRGIDGSEIPLSSELSPDAKAWLAARRAQHTEEPSGPRNVVIDGGGPTGALAALQAYKLGEKVTVVEMRDQATLPVLWNNRPENAKILELIDPVLAHRMFDSDATGKLSYYDHVDQSGERSTTRIPQPGHADPQTATGDPRTIAGQNSTWQSQNKMEVNLYWQRLEELAAQEAVQAKAEHREPRLNLMRGYQVTDLPVEGDRRGVHVQQVVEQLQKVDASGAPVKGPDGHPVTQPYTHGADVPEGFKVVKGPSGVDINLGVPDDLLIAEGAGSKTRAMTGAKSVDVGPSAQYIAGYFQGAPLRSEVTNPDGSQETLQGGSRIRIDTDRNGRPLHQVAGSASNSNGTWALPEVDPTLNLKDPASIQKYFGHPMSEKDATAEYYRQQVSRNIGVDASQIGAGGFELGPAAFTLQSHVSTPVADDASNVHLIGDARGNSHFLASLGKVTGTGTHQMALRHYWESLQWGTDPEIASAILDRRLDAGTRTWLKAGLPQFTDPNSPVPTPETAPKPPTPKTDATPDAPVHQPVPKTNVQDTGDATATRIQQLFDTKELNHHDFHGTSSELLDHLDPKNPTLMSSDAVRAAKADVVTPQSNVGSGITDSISVGRGESGLATATAYAEAKTSLPYYDPRLYSNDQLQQMIREYKQHTRTIVDIGASDKIRHDTPTVQGLHIEALEQELSRRQSNPTVGARPENAYPLVFEFDTNGLKHEDPNYYRYVKENIPLKDRLVRAFAPSDHLAEAKTRLEAMVGHPVEVLPSDAVAKASPNFADELSGARANLAERTDGGTQTFHESLASSHPGGIDVSPTVSYLREQMTMGLAERKEFHQLNDSQREAWYKLHDLGRDRTLIPPDRLFALEQSGSFNKDQTPEATVEHLKHLPPEVRHEVLTLPVDNTFIWGDLVKGGLGDKPFTVKDGAVTIEGRTMQVDGRTSWNHDEINYVLTGKHLPQPPQQNVDATRQVLTQEHPGTMTDANTLSATRPDPHHLREFFATQHSPAEIVDKVGQLQTPFGDTLAGEFTQSAGVTEGYKLGQHHRMVLGQYQKYFGDVEGATPGMDKQLFELTLALHDSGKAAATRAGDTSQQHQYTDKLIDAAMSNNQLPVSAAAVTRMKAVVNGDPLGAMFKGASTPDQAAAEVAAMAAPTGIPPKDFLRLLTTFYQSDAAAYTIDAGGKPSLEKVFQTGDNGVDLKFDPTSGRLKFSPDNETHFKELEKALDAKKPEHGSD